MRCVLTALAPFCTPTHPHPTYTHYQAPSGSDAAKLAKDMVAQWKSIAAGAKPGGASAKGGHSSAPTTATEVKQAPAAATSTSSSGNNIPLNVRYDLY